MAEKAQVSIKKPEPKRENKGSQTQKTGPSQSIRSPVEQILFLQRTIGNQAVGRLLKSGALQAKLKIGQPGDIYEQEADRVAEQVMRMLEPQVSNETKVSTPARTNPIQRKCPGCNKGTKKEDEEKLQKKEASGSTPDVTPELESSISAIRGGGQPLPESARAFYEPRFGADFGPVRVHTGSHAAETAKSINARAFTVGNNIAFGGGQFAPGSHEGRKLLAHELTHTIQQGANSISPSTNSVVQRKDAQPVDINNQEQNLKNDFNAILIATNAAAPGDENAKKKIRTLVLTFQKGFSEYKPSRPNFYWVSEEVIDSEYWRYANVYSKTEATRLAARLLLIGMPKESEIMYNYGKPFSMVGVFPRDQPDEFHKAYTQASLERIDPGSKAKTAASLEILLASFNYMVNEIRQLDMKKVEEDKKYADFYNLGEKVIEYGFLGEWYYYMSLVGHLGKLYGGMQQIIQDQMEKVFAELDKSGQAPSILNVYTILEKIEKGIPGRVKLYNPGPNTEFLDPVKATVAVTQTDFTKKGGLHRDVFDKSSKAPSVKIEFYDKDQKEGAEKFLPIHEIHRIRYNQLNFILSFYGLDKQGKKLQAKQGPAELMPGTKSFALFSLNDWKIFLDNKYDDLIKNQHVNSADAFLTIIGLLESYMKAFTIHTPYNIEDKGDNYLTKTFPRALTGQLIHDCGVYALKTVYLLSLLATRLKLKMQYIMLPNHVGLIIRGDQTPVIFVHNNKFIAIPLTETQFDRLNKDNQGRILSDREIAAYEKARKAGDTSGFIFTIDKKKQDWLKFTKDQKLPGPATEKQFLAETAANFFVSGVDMPFAVIDINSKEYDPKQKNEKIKKKLWADYQKIVHNTILFDKKALEKEYSLTYQFQLRYLNLTVEEKNFYNNILLPFWNFKARSDWLTLVKDSGPRLKANDKEGYIKLLQSYKDNFLKGEQNIERSYEPILNEKKQVHEIIATNNPKPLKAGIERTLRERSIGEAWRDAFRTHLDSIDQRINNLTKGKESLGTGKDITPAFATEADMLQYVP